MTVAGLGEFDTYRVIMLDHTGRQVLLVRDHDRFLLPSVQIPRRQRVAEVISAAVRNDWGIQIVCLLELNDSSKPASAPNYYCVAEFWSSLRVHRESTQWSFVSDLAPDSFADCRDYTAIRESLARCLGPMNDTFAEPFVRLGWLEDLRHWIASTISPMGFCLGDFRQLNASPSFALIRFETDGPAVWFKAVGQPNQREFSITCTLSQLFPKYLAALLAVRPECNGWLATDVPGELLAESQEAKLWERAATELADLQIRSTEHADAILKAGAWDLRIATLSAVLQPFLETMTRVMNRQTKVSPQALTRNQLLSLGEQIQGALNCIEALQIPETLGHLDLNPGNIVVSPDQCIFLDWAEAYVGLPFLSFEYLREHLRRITRKASLLEMTLLTLYCQRWKQVMSSAAIRNAFALSPLLAVFAYAVGNNIWKNQQRLEEPDTAGYFRSLTRRMYREANMLLDGRLACVC